MGGQSRVGEEGKRKREISREAIVVGAARGGDTRPRNEVNRKEAICRRKEGRGGGGGGESTAAVEEKRRQAS